MRSTALRKVQIGLLSRYTRASSVRNAYCRTAIVRCTRSTRTRPSSSRRNPASTCLAVHLLGLGQQYKADRLIVMTLGHFNRLAEGTRRHTSHLMLIFLCNQARCGSTLVTAVFKQTSRCVCFSDSTCLSTVCERLFTDGTWRGRTACRLFGNTIFMVSKQNGPSGDRTLAYVITPSVFDDVTMQLTR